MNEHAMSPRPVTDVLTMIGRSLRLSRRNLDALLTAVLLPVILMALFVYVFGGAIHTGTTYVNYVVPGIIVLCAGFGSATTAVSVCADMGGGIVDRFQSLPIASSAVLIGHIVASMARNLFSAALVVGTAVLMGFRPTAGPLAWLAATGVLLLFVLALSWLATVLGLLARSVEAANGFTFLILFLPYVSSAFVPTGTMPAWLRAVAEHQPITPVIETVRGLLTATPIGGSAWLAVVWCAGIALASFALATWLFQRRTRR
jgi:ABC-2 type transport system permease protein